MQNKTNLAWTLLLFAALLAIGFWGNRFYLYLTTQMMLLAIFAQGYNVLFGRTGLLSFGHGALYGAGAYGMGLFYMHVHPHPLLGVLAGVLLAAALAFVIGFFCVRHTEIYFAMLTLAFGMLVFSLVWNLREITGGDDGLVGIGRAPLDLGLVSLPIAKMNQFYFLVLAFFALSLYVVRRILGSPVGLLLSGVRENDQRAEFAAVPVKRYRWLAFVISGAFAGLAGSLGAMLNNNTDPFSLHWSHSAQPILVNLIGGLNSLAGPVLGSVIFVLFREIIQRFTQNWMLWFGIILLVIIMGFRGGLAGAVQQLGLAKRKPADSPGEVRS